MTVHVIAIGLLLVALAPIALVCLYLLLLTFTAPFGLRQRPRAVVPSLRFALLIPAHDEESTIPRLLANLRALDYPQPLFDVCVVADNCTDGTAVIATTYGARVFERSDSVERGKGYALQWLLEQLARAGLNYDAYVVIDADSVVSRNFLRAMCDRLSAGARAVQAYYAVQLVDESRGALLREAALAPLHLLRPAAKMALGASSGLKGNGMCFDRAVIEQFGWPTAGLAEDVEFHLALVEAGVRVVFAPEAVVRAEMPASLGGSASQHMRWEAGRLATVRGRALPLLRRGIRTGNVAALDAAAEQLVPPLSIPVAIATAGLAAGLLLKAPVVWLLAASLLAVQLVYVGAGLVLARVPWRVYAALLHVPVYVGWKCMLYARALVGPRERRWVRTARTALPPASRETDQV